MSAEQHHGLSADLLDDFFAECDEHLTQVRVFIASLDAAQPASDSTRTALSGIYARLHSFKGNCAIVGLTGAERTAHAAEGLVRGLSRAEITLSSETIQALVSAEKSLAEIVNAFRLHEPSPDVEDLLTLLVRLQAADASVANAKVSSSRDDGAGEPQAPFVAPTSVSSGTRFASGATPLWHATFVPSSELSERGVTITSVRALGRDRRGALRDTDGLARGDEFSFHARRGGRRDRRRGVARRRRANAS